MCLSCNAIKSRAASTTWQWRDTGSQGVQSSGFGRGGSAVPGVIGQCVGERAA